MTDPSHPVAQGPRPLALAHRGGAGEAVENSPEAFHHAVGLGFRWIETDVRATADGHAVLFHDALLDRTTDGSGPVATTSLAQLRACRLPNGETPLTLAEALATWPDVRFNVDVKSEDAVLPFAHAVQAADAWDRVSAASFSHRRLARLRRLGGARLATSMSPTEVTRLRLGLPGRGPAWAAQVPLAAGPVTVVTRGLVRRAHERGVQVHVWTVNDPAHMAALLDRDVDGIVTDRPSLLRDLLVAHGRWG